MRKNNALDKQFAAEKVRMTLISNATVIRDIIIKNSLKSFCGFIRHIFSYHYVPLLFTLCLVISFNLDKTLFSNLIQFSCRYRGNRDMPPSVWRYNGKHMETFHLV